MKKWFFSGLFIIALVVLGVLFGCKNQSSSNNLQIEILEPVSGQILALNKEVTVLGKGNKERTVFLDDVSIMVLTRYLSERKDDMEALFIGRKHERLTPGGVRNMLRNIAEKAGVENAYPHRFRRTLATNLIDHGMEIQNVAQILGHERLDTTMKYIYTSKGDLKNQYRKYA